MNPLSEPRTPNYLQRYYKNYSFGHIKTSIAFPENSSLNDYDILQYRNTVYGFHISHSIFLNNSIVYCRKQGMTFPRS